MISIIDSKYIERIRRSTHERDLLRKALGKEKNLNILDATAGLCRDALRMAYRGHTVWACERNAELAALLKKAIKEAKEHEFYSTWINRLNLVSSSTEDFLQNSTESFDIIVIDPMFPNEKRSALPKKDMQILGDLVGHEDNSEALLTLALSHAKKKILLKRPLKSPVIEIKKHNPLATFRGRAHRWDVYAGKLI